MSPSLTISGVGRNGSRASRAQTRSAAGTAAAMRSRECFMQIQMNHIDAHVARTCNADERVHIRAVHVDESAGRRG